MGRVNSYVIHARCNILVMQQPLRQPPRVSSPPFPGGFFYTHSLPEYIKQPVSHILTDLYPERKRNCAFCCKFLASCKTSVFGTSLDDWHRFQKFSIWKFSGFSTTNNTNLYDDIALQPSNFIIIRGFWRWRNDLKQHVRVVPKVRCSWGSWYNSPISTC